MPASTRTPRLTNHAHWRVDLAPKDRNAALVVTDLGAYAISCLPVA